MCQTCPGGGTADIGVSRFQVEVSYKESAGGSSIAPSSQTVMGPIPEPPAAERINLAPVYQEQFISIVMINILGSHGLNNINIYINNTEKMKTT